MWIMRPTSMKQRASDFSQSIAAYDLLDIESASDIWPSFNVKATQVNENKISRFEKFSTWKFLVRAICVHKSL